MIDSVASSQNEIFWLHCAYLSQQRIHSVFIDWVTHADPVGIMRPLQIQTLFIPHEDLYISSKHEQQQAGAPILCPLTVLWAQ